MMSVIPTDVSPMGGDYSLDRPEDLAAHLSGNMLVYETISSSVKTKSGIVPRGGIKLKSSRQHAAKAGVNSNPAQFQRLLMMLSACYCWEILATTKIGGSLRVDDLERILGV
jgi:hypothetical protein